jgi:hypothetical protein
MTDLRLHRRRLRPGDFANSYKHIHYITLPARARTFPAHFLRIPHPRRRRPAPAAQHPAICGVPHTGPKGGV